MGFYYFVIFYSIGYLKGKVMLYFMIFFLIKTVLVVKAVQYEVNQGLADDETKENQRNIIIMEVV